MMIIPPLPKDEVRRMKDEESAFMRGTPQGRFLCGIVAPGRGRNCRAVSLL